MFSKTECAMFWLNWNLGSDFTTALTIYQKLPTSLTDTHDPYGPPIYCPICRKRELTTDEVTRYGGAVAVDRARVFEIPDAPAGTDAQHEAITGTPPRGLLITVVEVSGAPAASDGVDGNYAFDTDGLRLYGPKASGAWPTTGVELRATEEGVLEEADGTRWSIKRIKSSIFDNLQSLICVPEV